MSLTEINIRAEATPNPASMRFILDRPVLGDASADFTDAAQAENSPLARRLFALAPVGAVYLGPNFITVTAEKGDWSALREQVVGAIREHFASGEPALVGAANGQGGDAAAASEVEAGIQRIIDEEIRPAVAMDGGDVVFVKYEDNVVYLRLRGACSGCPSAVFTLKMGIERLLKEQFPEIQEVKSI